MHLDYIYSCWSYFIHLPKLKIILINNLVVTICNNSRYVTWINMIRSGR